MAALQGHLLPLFDDRILLEYRAVLSRPKFSFAPTEVAQLVSQLQALGEIVDVGNPPPSVTAPDAGDEPFIQVAVAGRADAIVTGNRRHFPETIGVAVLSATDVLDELRRRTARTR